MCDVLTQSSGVPSAVRASQMFSLLEHVQRDFGNDQMINLLVLGVTG